MEHENYSLVYLLPVPAIPCLPSHEAAMVRHLWKSPAGSRYLVQRASDGELYGWYPENCLYPIWERQQGNPCGEMWRTFSSHIVEKGIHKPVDPIRIPPFQAMLDQNREVLAKSDEALADAIFQVYMMDMVVSEETKEALRSLNILLS